MLKTHLARVEALKFSEFEEKDSLTINTSAGGAYEHNHLKPMLILGGKTPDEAYHSPESSLHLDELIAKGRYSRKAYNRRYACGIYQQEKE